MWAGGRHAPRRLLPRRLRHQNGQVDWQRGAAVVAQFTQAGSSLLLSMVAVRALSTAEFGQYLLVASTIVIATGATTGLIGDSLTVLDRSQSAMRRTLQGGAAGASLLAGLLVLLVSGLLGWLPWTLALVASAAAVAFVLEDLARRMLMANRRFAGVVVTDLGYALIAMVVLGAAAGTSGIALSTMFVAITAGQSVALLVAVCLLPSSDRYLARLRGPLRVGELLGFGGWRALHLTVGPLKVWAARVMVSGLAGFSAVGMLEANRLVMAPLLLAVQGASSAILVNQVTLVRESPARARQQADRDARVLIASTGAALLALIAASDPLSRVLVGSADLIDPVVLLGWGFVAVGMAANIPYANLTAASGAARAALALRMADLLLMGVGMAALLALLPADTWYRWVPATIGVLSCALAGVQRHVAFRSLSPHRPAM